MSLQHRGVEEASWELKDFLFEDEGALYCNTPKYTLVVFNIFRVFYRYNLIFFFCNLNEKREI